MLVLLFEPLGLAGLARRLTRLAVRRRRWAAAGTVPAGLKPTPDRRGPVLTSAWRRLRVPAAGSTAARGRVRRPSSDVILQCPRPRLCALPTARSVWRDSTWTSLSGYDLAIVGRNGAGKTSALRAVAGYLGAERVRVSGSFGLQGARASPAGHRGIVVGPASSWCRNDSSFSVADRQ